MEMTEGRKHAVYAMPKPSSSSRKSSYDVLSAAFWRRRIADLHYERTAARQNTLWPHGCS